MDSRSKILCTALADDLNRQSALSSEPDGLPFTARRGYHPRLELRDVKDLTLFVVPATHAVESLDRGHTLRELGVWLAVIQQLRPGQSKRLDNEDLEQMDRLTLFVERLIDFYRPQGNEMYRLTATANGGTEYIHDCIEVLNDPVHDPDSLENHRQFLSVIGLTFQSVQS